MTPLQGIHAKLKESVLPALLPLDVPIRKFQQKVIHDHLWGSSTFYPWEIALLDTPLLQRLRQIHQLGTASFTYPSAVHNRFSHTLGVTVLAGQLITNLRDKIADRTIIIPYGSDSKQIVTQKDVYTIRLAALLHDIGHCFFSHCSESLAAGELADLKTQVCEQYKDFSSGEPPKPHELIAYSIITSDYFEEYWNKYILQQPFPLPEDVPTPQNFAKPIIGVFISDEKKYVTEILNGPYDVDKLEYLHRDAKSAGLAITYDRERFFQKITLHCLNGSWLLVMGVHGIQSVEQMMLNKMMLAPYVYHHQKVLAADALVRDIGDILLHDTSCHKLIVANQYLDFLLYTDADLLATSGAAKGHTLERLLSCLKNRKFPKRCFVLHKDFIKASSDKEASEVFSKIRREIFTDSYKVRKRISESIAQELKSSNDILYVYITSTSQKAKYKNIAKSAMVVTQDNSLAPLCEHWVMGNWDETYSAKKEYIYFHIAEEFIEVGFSHILKFLETEFSVQFDLSKIKRIIKFDSSVEGHS